MRGNGIATAFVEVIKMDELIPIERIESKIYVLRKQKVILDFHLAELYGVETAQLKRQVRRNAKRFPGDFMFQLSRDEYNSLLLQIGILDQGKPLRCQNGTSKRGGRRYLPYAFTEQGVAMLSSVLNSEKAVEVNIRIMRAFVRLRQVLSSNKDLTYLFKELRHKVGQHDVEIGLIIRAIEKMIVAEKKPKQRIGFL